jgi:hypothetical protein
MKHAVEMGSVAVIYKLSFINIGSGIQKWMEGDIQTGWRSRKCTLGK